MIIPNSHSTFSNTCPLTLASLSPFLDQESAAAISAVSKGLGQSMQGVLAPGYPRGLVINELEKSCFNRLKSKVKGGLIKLINENTTELKSMRNDALVGASLVAIMGVSLVIMVKGDLGNVAAIGVSLTVGGAAVRVLGMLPKPAEVDVGGLALIGATAGMLPGILAGLRVINVLAGVFEFERGGLKRIEIEEGIMRDKWEEPSAAFSVIVGSVAGAGAAVGAALGAVVGGFIKRRFTRL